MPALRSLVLGCVSAAVISSSALATPQTAAPARLPNLVVIFIDDLGYADIGAFGAKEYATPHLDRMAKEGRRFTDFVSSTAVCSASRAALLTGCYHRRVGIAGAFGPGAKRGINAREMTLAEVCKQKGYATACYGKWHLGHHPKFLPRQHGFDEYFGLPYSNDMWPHHPAYRHLPAGSPKIPYPKLPLIENETVVDAEVTGEDQTKLTTQYTERAVRFIEKNRERPFFLYVPHSMVHVPLYVSDKFKGKSKAGLFGDVMMEVDWSVGQILGALRKHGIDDETLVVFTGDNGPWLNYGDHAGSASPLREGKGTMWEGGIREPTLMWWPGQIPAGSKCDELASTIDVLPTVASLIGAKLPDHKIDGKDIRPLMFGKPDARSPHDAFYCYYANGELQAVRDRRWKLYFPHRYRTLSGRKGGTGGIPVAYDHRRSGTELYDLKNDISEITDVASKHSDVVARLQKLAEIARDDLGDRLTKRPGKGVRPAGKLLRGDTRLKW
ncbi:MAG: arylsulfatase [Planctomycetes bacterium]|nr:arylsulfatase [Planctomycetota bacterium]